MSRVQIVAIILAVVLLAAGVGSAADVDGDGAKGVRELREGSNPFSYDTDNDGLSDGAEIKNLSSSPVDSDTDSDSLVDGKEHEMGTSLVDSDSDSDSLSDGKEVNSYSTNPKIKDTDNDGLTDGKEINKYETDPLEKTSLDDDGDSLINPREESFGTNPKAPDTDNDNLNDGEEVNKYKTDPTKADTDGDDLSDGKEVIQLNTDPLKETNLDKDNDGLRNSKERDIGTSPTSADTDSDGLNDGEEVNRFDTKPTVGDTDGDGLEDGEEVNSYQTDPTKADTDGDGLNDEKEVTTYNTNPTSSDTDTDGLLDNEELNQGTEPNTPDTDSDGVKDGAEVDRNLDPNNPDTDGDSFQDGADQYPKVDKTLTVDVTYLKTDDADPPLDYTDPYIRVKAGSRVGESSVYRDEGEITSTFSIELNVDDTSKTHSVSIYALDKDNGEDATLDIIGSTQAEYFWTGTYNLDDGSTDLKHFDGHADNANEVDATIEFRVRTTSHNWVGLNSSQ